MVLVSCLVKCVIMVAVVVAYDVVYDLRGENNLKYYRKPRCLKELSGCSHELQCCKNHTCVKKEGLQRGRCLNLKRLQICQRDSDCQSCCKCTQQHAPYRGRITSYCVGGLNYGLICTKKESNSCGNIEKNKGNANFDEEILSLNEFEETPKIGKSVENNPNTIKNNYKNSRSLAMQPVFGSDDRGIEKNRVYLVRSSWNSGYYRVPNRAPQVYVPPKMSYDYSKIKQTYDSLYGPSPFHGRRRGRKRADIIEDISNEDGYYNEYSYVDGDNGNNNEGMKAKRFDELKKKILKSSGSLYGGDNDHYFEEKI